MRPSNCLTWQQVIPGKTAFHAVCVSPKYGYYERFDHVSALKGSLPKIVHSTNITQPVRMETNFGSNIRVIRDLNDIPSTRTLAETDAVITNCKAIPFYFLPGDCLPIYLWDQIHSVGALIHASWKQIRTLPEMVVKHMTELFQSKPTQISAIIGPSISKCCYKLPIEVTAQTKMPEWQPFIQLDNDEVAIDLKKCASSCLYAAGLLNVGISSLCTACATINGKFIFPSYHREHNNYRFVASMTLVEI